MWCDHPLPFAVLILSGVGISCIIIGGGLLFGVTTPSIATVTNVTELYDTCYVNVDNRCVLTNTVDDCLTRYIVNASVLVEWKGDKCYFPDGVLYDMGGAFYFFGVGCFATALILLFTYTQRVRAHRDPPPYDEEKLLDNKNPNWHLRTPEQRDRAEAEIIERYGSLQNGEVVDNKVGEGLDRIEAPRDPLA